MGLCNSPDIFQEKMSELFDGLEFVRTYIDYLLILFKEGSYQDHLEKLEKVLAQSNMSRTQGERTKVVLHEKRT